MADGPAIGFIGTGTMGEPMCRNLVLKSGRPVVAFDRAPEPLARLAADGAAVAGSIADVAARAETIFVCLPSGAHVAAVCDGPDGLLAHARAGQTVVDCGTSPVALARDLARRFAASGADFADAPVARTRQAAQQGTLSVMVGATPAVYARLEPLIGCFASDVTHCGPVGSGQVVKIMNNMVLAETVAALAEALAIGRRAGVDPAVLFDTLAKGSADSFALRNHGMKAMLPGDYPERAFSAEYQLKDLGYALDLAAATGVAAPGAEHAAALLRAAIARGLGAQYWPVIAKVVDDGV
ncbi:MAG: NAD(P)-dependent oxidoreductase [Alphaproteobacteria bacterium]